MVRLDVVPEEKFTLDLREAVCIYLTDIHSRMKRGEVERERETWSNVHRLHEYDYEGCLTSRPH